MTNFFSVFTFGLYFLFLFILFQFPGGLPPGMPGMPPGGPPRIDLPVSLGSNLAPPRGSDPLMSLGPSAPPGSSGPHNSGGPAGLRAPNSNDKVTRLYFLSFLLLGNPRILAVANFICGQLETLTIC